MLTRNLVGITCCGVALSLSLFSLAQAQDSPSPSDNMKTFSQTDQTGFKEGRFRGEVVRIDGQHYIIKTKDGEEMRLHLDKTTKKTGTFKQGDGIEAEVGAKNHVLSIKPYPKDPVDKSKQQ